MTRFAILIPTYWKTDDSTKDHLERCLVSVKNQTHGDYKVFLIGDKYANGDQLTQLASIIEPRKIKVVNLHKAYEREKYTGRNLWVCGGVNASNVGIDLALSEGFSWICHLDHDDWWESQHLEELSKAIDETSANFLTTRCGPKWPAFVSTDYYTKYRPVPSKIVKSTTCVNYRYFKVRFRNMIEEFNKVYASDADLWDQISKILASKNEWGCLIDVQTMYRGSSQVVIRNPQIIK